MPFEGESKPLLHKRTRSWGAWLCDSLDAALDVIPCKHAGEDYLKGPYAPTNDIAFSKNLTVVGNLPSCLNGEFVRVGPNPKYYPKRGYHLFDGDGMLHGVRIKDGTANYVNRYVQTYRWQVEEAEGQSVFLKLGEIIGIVGLLRMLIMRLRYWLKVLDKAQGAGTANTALVYHGKRLMALHEGDAPYVVRLLEDGELETRGRYTYDQQLQHPFTAHPKIDHATGEMFMFGYDVSKMPCITYRVISKDGHMGKGIPITTEDPIMLHDFAITENFAIFMDLPLVFDPSEIIKGRMPFKWKEGKQAKFGILPRYAASEAEIKWFSTEPLFIFHTANAWEEGSQVILYACCYDQLDLELSDAKKMKKFPTMRELRFDMKEPTNVPTVRKLSDTYVEFPRINENLIARKQRFVYACTFLGDIFTGCAKFDLGFKPAEGNDTVCNSKGSSIELGGSLCGYFGLDADCCGSEPVFVPRSDNPGADEDDGFILMFSTNQKTGTSEVLVVDAKHMSKEPSARILLPHRVPQGFHGIFVSEEQLQAQLGN